MRDPQLIRMGYFRVRIRTHEWAEGECVSLLNVKGIGKARMNLLWQEGFNTASRIMETPTGELVERLAPHDSFFRNEAKTRKLIEHWRAQIRELWREKTNEPIPRDWR